MTGTITRGMGGLYYVRGEEDRTDYVLRARGKLRRDGLSPMVGDRVSFTPGAGEIHGWLETIQPRVTACIRPPVANVEMQLLVIAPTPAPDLLLVDRLMVRAEQAGIQPVLCVNKCDLDETLAARMAHEYEAVGVPVLAVSALTGAGLDTLIACMAGKICCFAGQSGVGKTTLLNTLLGLSMQTGEISQKIDRGKHTTRHVELIEQGNLRVLDTPGFSLLSLEAGMEPEDLQNYYPEMAGYTGACKFQPCLHDTEPGCAVRAAADEGKIATERLARYRTLLAEVKESWRGRYD